MLFRIEEEGGMSKKRYRPEEIIGKLRETEVLISPGKKVVDVIKALGVTDLTYCRWRQEYGGMDVSKENDQPARWHTGQLGGMSIFWKSVFLNEQPDNKRSDISFHKSSDEKKRHYNMNISFYG